MPPLPPAYLAFDLGASSGRAVLGRLQEGRMLLEVVHRFPTPLLETNGRLTWDHEALWDALQQGLHEAQAIAPNLRSVSVDSWAVDYVPLDQEGHVLRPPYAYRDPIRNTYMDKALQQVPADLIYAKTGIQFLPFNTLYQVLADQDLAPEEVAQTANRLLIADYFNHRFGGDPVVDLSMASTTQVMDARTQSWSHEVLQAFDLPEGGWPSIVPCGTRIGQLHGHPETAVIASCSHDTAAAVAAVPAHEADGLWAYISCGTWSLMGVEVKDPLLTQAAQQAGFTNEAGVDGTIRFLKNLTGLWALQECMRAWQADDPTLTYPDLLQSAAAMPSLGIIIDLEDPVFLPRGDMIERLQTYCHTHDQPIPKTHGDITRAILENIARSYRRTLQVLEALFNTRIDPIHLVGGGSQNGLLCQLTADACQRTVIAGPVEATALGNLLVQAQTLGDLPTGMTARAVARASSNLTTYSPT